MFTSEVVKALEKTFEVWDIYQLKSMLENWQLIVLGSMFGYLWIVVNIIKGLINLGKRLATKK